MYIEARHVCAQGGVGRLENRHSRKENSLLMPCQCLVSVVMSSC